MDLDDASRSAPQAEFGTKTIKDTVNEALRRATKGRQARIAGAFALLADVDLKDRNEAWR